MLHLPPTALGSPGDWELLAQGAANYVLQRQGPDQDVGWLLRIPKIRQPPDLVSAFLETQIWAPFLQGLNSGNPADLDESYVRLVMGPLVDAKYLPVQHWVPVEPAFLVTLAQRPCLERLDVDVRRVMLMRDSRLLPADTSSGRDLRPRPTVSVEIKPKWGALPHAHTVPPQHRAAKLGASRYQLHQHLKAATGAIEVPSEYDPLDLFSGEAGRVWTALQALGRSPQNNFLTAVDGKPGGLHSASVALLGPCRAVHDTPGAALLTVVRDVLVQEDALAQILDVQRLCSTDIHAVHAQYQALLDAASPEVREQGILPPTPALEAALSLLRDYLTSCTARDCALLLALRRESSGGGPMRPQTAEAPGRVTLHGGGAVFYRLTVIDLDRKPVSKLARHLALDAEIMRVAGGIEPAADHDLE
uniref:Inositol-pentakisphosphate 2-kinase n=1 Tax=Auxenochlorella protothecoides TaxID=3075 RepID=A0A1D2A661_AUXPR